MLFPPHHINNWPIKSINQYSTFQMNHVLKVKQIHFR